MMKLNLIFSTTISSDARLEVLLSTLIILLCNLLSDTQDKFEKAPTEAPAEPTDAPTPEEDPTY